MKPLHLLLSLSLLVCLNNACNNNKSDNSQDAEAKTSTAPDYSGTYEYASETASGTVEIKTAASGQIEFEITVADQSGCTGDIFGTAALENGVATYSAEDCAALKFEFSASEVTVSEQDCDFYHGLQCAFAGTYEKQ